MSRMLILSAIGLTSCAWYGSSGRVYDKTFKQPRQVVVFFHETTQLSDIRSTDAHQWLIQESLHQLTQQDKIAVTVIDKDFSAATFPRSFQNTLDTLDYDALLFVERTFFGMNDQIVSITLTDKALQKVAEARHNTFWGNSYWWPPDLQTATSDAVIGAHKKLFEKMRKLPR